MLVEGDNDLGKEGDEGTSDVFEDRVHEIEDGKLAIGQRLKVRKKSLRLQSFQQWRQ